jgi:hypothetical protein
MPVIPLIRPKGSLSTTFCEFLLPEPSPGHNEDTDLAVKAFGLSQNFMEKWLTADYAAKGRILEILCLNFRLDDVNHGSLWRKRFGVLAKAFFVQ